MHILSTYFFQCTKSCGSGTRKRYVSCRDMYDNEIREDECGYIEKPSSEEVCNNKPCPQWRTGEWNQVGLSATFTGVKHIDLKCSYKREKI